GLPNERPVFGGSGRIQDAEFTVIIDPIDGTRGLMYAKRSAWILSGIARGASENLRLNDIIAAVQTEIPSPKQYLADQLFAFSGGGASAVRCDARTGEKLTQFVPRPSGAKNLRYGFASFCRFFPAAKDVVTAIECELNKRLASEKEENFYFEDQYICNSGQMFELIAGHDRLICDLRAVISRSLVKAGERPLLCSHPYDVCGELIARECGVIVTDEKGEQLNAPLDTTTDVSWIGYANKHIKALVEPHLLDILKNVDSYVASSL
ncbi:MAG TPA: inositol monophosphatase, partial [bacterium]|nr:inositol monophosphatase [bacterium]